MGPDWITNGKGDASHVFLFAHGSGTAMDAAPMEQVARGLAKSGIDVIRFEFPYMQARRSDPSRSQPDPDPILRHRFLEVIGEVKHPGRLVVGGYSLGGRIAVQIAEEAGARALCCLSYPFHPPREPSERAATKILMATPLPTLIIQGSRDSFGNREQVRGYRLPPQITLHWLEHANHALLAPDPSSSAAQGQLENAIVEAARFIAAH
jgi:predicted alpha/beta-hydrolase family hydrolase